MPFGMGPAGWAYVSPYAYPYAGANYSVWPGPRTWPGLGAWLALVYTLSVPVVVEPQSKSFIGGEICLTDLVEVEVWDAVFEVAWASASEVALLPGLM